MSKYALWYFKPKWGNYGMFDTNKPASLRELGFDYMIALDTVGPGGKYGQMPRSGYSYDDGYKEGKELAQWIEHEVNPELLYLVEIPVLVKEDNAEWELFKKTYYKIPPDVRGLDYWKGWIDGVYTNTGELEKGFYWNLEFPWQVVRGVVSESAIKELSEKIMNWQQEFIWIPYAHGDINWENTDIKTLDRYFTYIFAQPNYYQGKTQNLEDWFKSFKEFRDKYSLNNIYMEMECDGGVISGKKIKEDDHYIYITADTLKERACKYVQYAKNFPHRAYYFDTDVENLKTMNKFCRRNCHEKEYNCGDVNGYVF